jgi:hypothetical protein
MTDSQPQGLSSSPSQAFRHLGFVTCLILLLALTMGFKGLAAKTGVQPGPKKEVLLRKPLKELDVTKLAPYELVFAGDIKQEILDNLGTDKYIEWTLRDTSIKELNAPEALVHLFVTYYTNTPAQVVHVPEECYLGNGYSTVGSEVVHVRLPQSQEDVSIKVLTFERSAFLGRESRVAMYTFHVNGQFASEGRLVTAIHNSTKSKHGYFSKVEVSFGTAEASPSAEKSIEAGKRILQKVLPILIQDHWPDWQKVEGKDSPTGGAAPIQAASVTRGQ